MPDSDWAPDTRPGPADQPTMLGGPEPEGAQPPSTPVPAPSAASALPAPDAVEAGAEAEDAELMRSV
ncbi:MAG TPA: hypothetical protein VGJ17_00760, partial [Candidatus Limnocylindrales bacterium]